MTKTVFLLRGINVGGHGKLPMADLRAHVMELGATKARTYLQSGNCVVEGNIDQDALADRIEKFHGFRPSVMSRPGSTWAEIVTSNPFESNDAACIHCFFMAAPAQVDLDPLRRVADNGEQVKQSGAQLWLHAPGGIGRSKLAARMEALAKRPLTARKLRTVLAIAALLDEMN